MPNYKLIYFNVRARAEIVRILFAAAGVKYEDVRYESPEWAKVKSTVPTPFGQLPVLEVDGVQLCQSRAIARYLAGQFGFAGETALDKARVDMIVDCLEDLMGPSIEILHENDETRKAVQLEKFTKETLPAAWKSLEKLLKANNGGDSYLVGNKITLADIAFADQITWLGGIGINVSLDDSPKLKALKERVESVPKIAEWIKNRPVTQL